MDFIDKNKLVEIYKYLRVSLICQYIPPKF